MHSARAAGQRGWNGQPDGIASGLGSSPRKRRFPADGRTPSGGLHGRGSAQQRLGVGMARRRERRARRGRARPRGRDTSPRRGARCGAPGADRARRTGSSAPSSLLQLQQQVDDLRLHRDVERRDQLVGDQARRARPPARGRCRCAGAGRRRIRAGSASAASARQPHQVEQFGDARGDAAPAARGGARAAPRRASRPRSCAD